MNDDPTRWGKPLAALLGALDAQMGLGIASIGGKDSMSGSFEGLDVPPTLVSFATAIGNVKDVQSPEFKKANSSVVMLRPQYKDGLPEIGSLISIYKTVEQMIDEGKVLAAATPGYGCVAEALFKMCVGNHVGLQLSNALKLDDLFKPAYGAVILELLDPAAGEFWASPRWITPWKQRATRSIWLTCRSCGKPSWSRSSPTARKATTYRR